MMQNTEIELDSHSEQFVQIDLGGGGHLPEAESAKLGGVRAARLGTVIAEIDRGFSDQQFSTRALATKLGLSVRYVQDLLKASGVTVTERILELRLQKAEAMLQQDLGRALKVSEVAATCGFSEVSYFHRCFRRRFGSSPAKLRARSRSH
jgi:transcriptional regulator GlxA family with amidase domain